MDRSDVVAAINELAGQGFVERAPDPDDRRRNIVTLTNAGQRQLRRLDVALDKAQDDLLGPLAAAERQTLTDLLLRLLAHHRD
jgi:DNA-binding MarR family transcriptional regulator